MKFFVTVANWDSKKYRKNYQKLLSYLSSVGVDVLSVQKQDYSQLINKERIISMGEVKAKQLYVRKCIDIANAVIVETSENDFRLGYESMMAVMLNKPVLLLSEKGKSVEFIEHSNIFKFHYTNLLQLEKIITQFVKDVKNKYLTVRFNCFLSPRQKNFLDWLAKKEQTNNSVLIRDFIEKEIVNTSDYVIE